MSEKRFNSRIICKHDIEENWLKATNFIPLKGEVIIYDADGTFDYPRIKIGDGQTLVSALPFINEIITDNEINTICGATIYTGDEVVL